jgi:hypothetical protein
VTARHVVSDVRIVEIGRSERTQIVTVTDEGAETHSEDHGDNRRVTFVRDEVLELDGEVRLHPDEQVDVAGFRVKSIDREMPVVQLGGHLDDFLGESDFTLFEVVIFGHPIIPVTKKPHLVAARAEVNAQIDLRDRRHVHFVLSAVPRGGFSGGPVITEGGYALGLVTSSLVRDGNVAEFGFFTAISVEPIYECLAQHQMLPAIQAEGWGDLWKR